MKLAADDRPEADAPRSAPRNARLGGTDIFRGALVILTAVVIGGFVISRGLDNEDRAESTTAPAADVDPAGAGAGQDDANGDSGDESSPTTPSTLVDDSALTGATTDEGTADDTTATAEDGTAAGDDSADDAMEDGSDATPTALRPPAEVKVLVLNGAQTQGIAARGTEALQAASYLTAAPKNATTQRPSAIYYADGYQLEAAEVATVFGSDLGTLVQALDPADPPIDDLQDANVIVVIGTDDLIPIP